MGSLCSLPEVNITDEQIDSIKELINNADSFKNIYHAIPFLVPIHANENANDLDKTFDAFSGDKRMLSTISGRPDALDGVSASIESSMEKISEAVNPLVSTMLSGTLKEQLPDNVPDSVKDKAVTVALEKTVELSVSQVVKTLVEKQMKNEFPAPPESWGAAVGGGGGATNVAASTSLPTQQQSMMNNSSSSAPPLPRPSTSASPPSFVSPVNHPDIIKLQQFYSSNPLHAGRLQILNQSVQSGVKSADEICREELMYVISSTNSSSNSAMTSTMNPTPPAAVTMMASSSTSATNMGAASMSTSINNANFPVDPNTTSTSLVSPREPVAEQPPEQSEQTKNDSNSNMMKTGPAAVELPPIPATSTKPPPIADDDDFEL